MSSCLILQDKNKLFMGADSALIETIEDIHYRISDNGRKIFNFKNSIMFCSGNIKIVNKVIEFIGESIDINIYKLSEFIKQLNLQKNDNIFNVEIIIVSNKNNRIELCQISEYNNFDIVKYNDLTENIRIISGGIKTEECLDLATNYFNKKYSVFNIFENTYNDLSCEEIGGNLEIWEISNEIKKVKDFPIKRKSIRIHISEFENIHSLVADVIVGRLLAGNELLITNENNTFTLNGSGATLVDASFTLTRSDGNSKIIIDPNVGIEIDKRVSSSGSYVQQLYIDTQGNVIFAGNLSAAGGTFSGTITALDGYIGGWKINADGLSSPFGDYINSDGNIRLGMLTIHGDQAEFNGDIYANNLQGLIQYNQIGSVDATTIVTGTLSAIDIYGCNIYWPGVWMHGNEWGMSLIEAQSSISMTAGISPANAGIDISANANGQLRLFANDSIFIGRNLIELGTPVICLLGSIYTEDAYMNKGTGISGTFVL